MKTTKINRQKELELRVDRIYHKIFARTKKRPLGIHGMAAEYAFETNQKELHIKELKQQIHSTRPYMEELYGKDLIQEIHDLPIKFRKLKRLSIYKVLNVQN